MSDNKCSFRNSSYSISVNIEKQLYFVRRNKALIVLGYWLCSSSSWSPTAWLRGSGKLSRVLIAYLNAGFPLEFDFTVSSSPPCHTEWSRNLQKPVIIVRSVKYDVAVSHFRRLSTTRFIVQIWFIRISPPKSSSLQQLFGRCSASRGKNIFT